MRLFDSPYFNGCLRMYYMILGKRESYSDERATGSFDVGVSGSRQDIRHRHRFFGMKGK